MRKVLVLLGTLALVVLGGHLVGACLAGDFTVLPPEAADAGEGGTAAGKTNGGACAAGPECSSGNCADGVCCDSACNGTCEKCSPAGVCVPVPDGQDPDKECPTTPLPPRTDDAGTPSGDAGAPSGDAGDEGGTDEAGTGFTIPDAGLTTDDNMCAGKCNGKRACAYAGAERTCGAAFCGDTSEQGRASCDGKGHCLYGIEECSAFSCPSGAPGCKTTCAAETDCLATHFCDVATSTCKAKVANGSACNSVTQCASGNCVGNVCCNSPCDIAGGTCTKSGSVGTCLCSACPSGPCSLYYQDVDGDGYGNSNGKIADGTAAYGCTAGPAPVGFVDNKLDCYDAVGSIPASVHPNQLAGVYYSSAYTIPGGSASFDYDCDSFESKETREYAGSTGCRYCNLQGAPLVGCKYASTCSTTSQVAGLGCKSSIFINSCASDPTAGFITTVACGDTDTRYSCGSCSGIGGAPSTSAAAGFRQRCR
jgi:hypothetical protein